MDGRTPSHERFADRVRRMAFIALACAFVAAAVGRAAGARESIDVVVLWYLVAAGVCLLVQDATKIILRKDAIEISREAATAIDTMGVGGPRAVGGEPATRSQVVSSVGDDPNAGRFGGKSAANARELSADVSPVEGHLDWSMIRLRVASTDPARPMTGIVEFHLHPTFRVPVRTVSVRHGVAELTVVAWGAFTVGAISDEGRTQLELNLVNVPGGSREFYTR